MSIIELKPGEFGYIDGVFCNSLLTKRLLSLGCTKGTKVRLKTVAPFGDPIVINLRGFDLAIRKKDAKDIKIIDAKENLNDNSCINR